MRDVHCCQVPTAAMETQCAAFHHPLHSKCYWCIAPKQVPKAAVPLLRKLRHLHCYCIVRYIVQCWLLRFVVFPVEVTIKQLTTGKRQQKLFHRQLPFSTGEMLKCSKGWHQNTKRPGQELTLPYLLCTEFSAMTTVNICCAVKPTHKPPCHVGNKKGGLRIKWVNEVIKSMQ